MSVDSESLFKQVRLEMKAAGAYFEAAQSAQRYIAELQSKREETHNQVYRKALAIGVPAYIAGIAAKQASDSILKMALDAHEEGLTAVEMANYHRACGEALLNQYERARANERLAREN